MVFNALQGSAVRLGSARALAEALAEPGVLVGEEDLPPALFLERWSCRRRRIFDRVASAAGIPDRGCFRSVSAVCPIVLDTAGFVVAQQLGPPLNTMFTRRAQ